MHIYFEFYVKVEKMLERKNSEYITAFSAKKIQISFYNHYSVYQTFFFFSEVFTFNYIHITGNKTFFPHKRSLR